MKLVKIVNVSKKFVCEDGKERPSTQYRVVLDNGNSIAIKPCFKADYKSLDIVSEVLIRGVEDESNKK